MTRAILRHAAWHLGADTTPGIPQDPQCAVQCGTCGERINVPAASREAAEDWALEHTGKHPAHQTYRAARVTYWRVSPTGANPYPKDEGADAHETG
ncbi:hypothetical protein ACFTXJ_26575 [Streptomyces zhihengii]|uniref:DUF7848 domain-containing protein n=1 Tax=Streptomyces zhihengii TaxID=1818004 RepID=UPI003626E620